MRSNGFRLAVWWGLASWVCSGAAFAADEPPAGPRAEFLGFEDDAQVKTWTPPAYPPELLAARMQGSVTVHLTVDASGAAQNVRVQSSTDPRFVPPVLAAVREATFTPAKDGDKPIPMDVSLVWPFRLPYNPPKVPVVRPLPRTKAVAEVTPGPIYPDSLLGRRLEGEVVTEIIVAADGSVKDVTVVSATTADFIRPAIDAVRKWTFRPARQGDLGVEEKKVVPLTFEYEPGADEMNQSVLAANGLRVDVPEGQTEKSVCDAPPTPLVWVDPVFPFELLKSPEPAEAEVSFTVNLQGVPEDVFVRNASAPEAGLSLAAAVEASLFRPAMQDGKGTAVKLVRKHTFAPPPATVAAKESDEVRLLRALQAGESIPSGKGLDARIRPVWRTVPILPSQLRAAKEAGVAEIDFVIDRTGRARVPRILSATKPEMGWAAATAVAQWVFDPPTRGGQPVDVRIRVPMQFKPE